MGLSEFHAKDQELLDLLSQMIAIESINPELSEQGSGETNLAEFLGAYLEAAGFEVHYQIFAENRKNIIARLRGRGGGKHLMLNGHLDTVGVVGMDIYPYEARIEEGRMYGRGSMDMKSGVAAMIMAAKRIKEAEISLRGDIILACVGDEEYLSKGTEKLLEDYTADAAIVPEPTDLEMVLAHKGFTWADFLVEGRAAHGSRPEVGKDAILESAYLLTELLKWEENELPKRQHPLLGRPSLHASIIEGGTEMSIYPHECNLSVEWRTLPGEDIAFVRKQTEEILRRLRKQKPDINISYELHSERKPLELKESERICQCLG
ncbi:MAG: M20/M25/M40 family metallo-hydrolase, partial [Bacteroidota bacterium]